MALHALDLLWGNGAHVIADVGDTNRLKQGD
jgi:hypothetical protein